MRSTPPKTPLIALLRMLNKRERELLAEWSGTSVSYLYALGSCSRCHARLDLAKALADATVRMRRHKRGVTPVLTMEQLATMCACVQ